MLWHIHAHTHTHTHTLCCIESKGSCPHSIKYELYLTNNWSIKVLSQPWLYDTVKLLPCLHQTNGGKDGYLSQTCSFQLMIDVCLSAYSCFGVVRCQCSTPSWSAYNSIHPCATNTCYKQLILVSFNFPVRCQAILKHEASEQDYVSTHHPCVCSHATIFWGHKWKVVNQNGTF